MSRWILPAKAWVRENTNPAERQAMKRRRRFYSQMISRGDLCFDIGANVGTRTSVFRALGATVVAVEPQPQLAEYLRRRYPTHVVVIEAGAGSAEGKRTLHMATSHTVATMSDRFVAISSDGRFGSDVQWTDDIDVPVTTLDALIGRHGRPSFIKIDVEGSEVDVLRGLSTSVQWISFEYTKDLHDNAERCIDVINALGDYHYCYSSGESYEWLLPTFGPPEGVLAAAHARAPWGDVYAQRVTVPSNQ